MNLQVAIVISAFGFCITTPIFVRYFAYANFPLCIKIIGFLICCFVAISPVFASRNWAEMYGHAFPIVEHSIYFIYIFAVILFSFTLMRDIIWFIISFFKGIPNPSNPLIFNKVNFITLLIALGCTAWSLYEGVKAPSEKHTVIFSPKIQNEKTVVVLSDLHISRTISPNKIRQIVTKTNALNPDIILLAGDTVDDDIASIQSSLTILGNLKAKKGVYFVSGNHEFYIGYQAAIHALEKVGLTSIENKRMALEPDFYIAGVSDIPTTQRFRKTNKTQEVLLHIPETAYTLFVSHSPTPLDLPYDLQVSGHTHGGQIFPFHFFSWLGNHHLLAGFYPKERIYVSRGSGQWGPQMRFLAPAEITVLHLKK